MKVKKIQKTATKVGQPAKKREVTSNNLIEAIKKAFKGTKDRIDARYLWTTDSVHRFRVNCWNNNMIQHSEFVYVVERNKKVTVRREQ